MLQALRETQKMAARFERANSAHAAAKEMVFLAEEGLKAEGRTFDHAWQASFTKYLLVLLTLK